MSGESVEMKPGLGEFTLGSDALVRETEVVGVLLVLWLAVTALLSFKASKLVKRYRDERRK